MSDTLAMAETDDAQPVRGTVCVESSLRVAVPVSWRVSPATSVAPSWSIAIDVRTGAVTVSDVEAVTAARVAVIVVVPVARVVASPGLLVNDTMPDGLEVQVTDGVTSFD